MDTDQKIVQKRIFVSPKEIKAPKPSELPIPTIFFKAQKPDVSINNTVSNQNQQQFIEQLNKWFSK